MQELREQAGTVFLVSHNLDVITETCNRALWVDQGRIRAHGDAASVIAAYTEAD